MSRLNVKKAAVDEQAAVVHRRHARHVPGPWLHAPGPRGELVRVLVTGNNGYIGSVLTALLKRADHEVVGLDDFMGSRFLRVKRVRELQESGRLDDELRWSWQPRSARCHQQAILEPIFAPEAHVLLGARRSASRPGGKSTSS
jgi:hypothetical protein